MKLRVWWIPQVPMKAFYVPVNSLEEARLILDSFAAYDLFQFENRVRPDYANVGGLEMFDEEVGEWTSWYDEETCTDDFDEYSVEKKMDRFAEIKAANKRKTMKLKVQGII
jgi:hypothetical protein